MFHAKPAQTLLAEPVARRCQTPQPRSPIPLSLGPGGLALRRAWERRSSSPPQPQTKI